MRIKSINIFSEKSLVVLVSVITLFLQLISFATTWNGSKIYLEGVFPYASLLFAVAIQATAYFFSNSMRIKISVLKVVALVLAICCSTYYSYVGIYNSVNSPVRFLQERYIQISRELIGVYNVALENNMGEARKAVSDAASQITAYYTGLNREKENIEACRTALSEETESIASGMRAPRQSDYDVYEDYVAAYNAYVEGISTGSNSEEELDRNGILAKYGYESLDALTSQESTNVSEISSLEGALGLTGKESANVLQVVADISVDLATSMNEASLGVALGSEETEKLNRLFQTAGLCGYHDISASDIINIVKRCAETTKASLLADYNELVLSMKEGRITSGNTMELKSEMDAQILAAILKINSLVSEDEQISYSSERYMITDLYLIPVVALQDTSTMMTAFFCMAVAALVDILSILFAISLRNRKPIWKRRSLLFVRQEDYEPQIFATLQGTITPKQALVQFLKHFAPSPQTEADGYMMCADIDSLEEYHSLVALLCQLNLAKIVPAGWLENDKEMVLLRARFVFWANSTLYESLKDERQVSA